VETEHIPKYLCPIQHVLTGKRYFKAINGMLDHQIEFSKATAEMYKPISGRMSDPDSFISEGNTEGIAACEEYEAIVQDLKASLQPELEMIEARVVKPAEELQEIIKAVRKLASKRDHKQLDYDRHRATLKKLQEKKDKQLKDEKALYKAENEVELATQEYEMYNNLMKQELPELFRLEREFILPLFQSFYYMQLNVFYTLHERMQSIDIGYFNLQLNIEEAFEEKRGDTQEKAEALMIVHFKTKGMGRPASKFGNQKLLGDKPSASRLSTSSTRPAITYGDEKESNPPPYESTAGSSALARAASKKGPAPPPPKPKPAKLAGAAIAETVTALYDYEAQAEGDLSFSAGDVIEIVTRTQNDNEWWTGKIHGRQGQFPGMFYAMCSVLGKVSMTDFFSSRQLCPVEPLM